MEEKSLPSCFDLAERHGISHACAILSSISFAMFFSSQLHRNFVSLFFSSNMQNYFSSMFRHLTFIARNSSEPLKSLLAFSRRNSPRSLTRQILLTVYSRTLLKAQQDRKVFTRKGHIYPLRLKSLNSGSQRRCIPRLIAHNDAKVPSQNLKS